MRHILRSRSSRVVASGARRSASGELLWSADGTQSTPEHFQCWALKKQLSLSSRRLGKNENRCQGGFRLGYLEEIVCQDHPVWVSWLDYPTLLTGLQTGHPLEVLRVSFFPKQCGHNASRSLHFLPIDLTHTHTLFGVSSRVTSVHWASLIFTSVHPVRTDR